VLLALIVRDGIQALSRARGMFALAVWDSTARTLTVARDRFGIKPLYVAEIPARCRVRIRNRALRRAGLVERDVSAAGVLAFLAWSYIPSPLTWLRGVEHFAPGTWKTWRSDGSQESGAFADFTHVYQGDTAQDERELCVRASDAIRDSIAAHMVADVPVGVFCPAASIRQRSSHMRATPHRVNFTPIPWRVMCLRSRKSNPLAALPRSSRQRTTS
jgi:asparagine synthase (glutamine-hydrolysing)